MGFTKVSFLLKLNQCKYDLYFHRFGSNNPSETTFPHVYIRNNRKSTHFYIQTLDVANEDQILFTNSKKYVRQITIYEMTKQQSVYLNSSFSWIQILTLHVNTLEWFSSSDNWLYDLLTNMTSLFSLTIYYPKTGKNYRFHDVLFNTLVTLKKHFYIKCDDGVLNLWF